jgi:2-methylcitrate dehydratase PrpD
VSFWDYSKIGGGKKESTVWVYGGKLPCVNAAQMNATMIHASDYDDTHDPSPIHTGVVSVPPAFAIAEKLGGIDGKKMLTAVALGADLAIRMCMACKISMFESGWHYTALHGSFAAAAVAGKLMGLDEERLVSAFGLVYHQAGGNMQCGHDGTLAKRVGAGFAVRNGIVAALMAERNITGTRNVFEGHHGLFNVYHRGKYDPDTLTSRLGERYEVTDLSFKPYPCCRNDHPSIDAALAIVHENNIRPEEVAAVTIHVSPGAMGALCEPLDVKRNPRTIVDAQFSIPWTVAAAVALGRVGLEAFTEQAIKDKAILSVSNKVMPKSDSSLDKRGVTPAIVEIKTMDGEVYSRRVDSPYGGPGNPMTMDAVCDKFSDCASHAVRPMERDKVEEIIQLVSRIETLNDVNQAVRLLDISN